MPDRASLPDQKLVGNREESPLHLEETNLQRIQEKYILKETRSLVPQSAPLLILLGLRARREVIRSSLALV